MNYNIITTILTSFQHRKFLNDKHFCGNPTEGKNPEANVRTADTGVGQSVSIGKFLSSRHYKDERKRE